MLMQLGPLQFTVAPLNANEVGHEGSASFAEHPVVGAMPPIEFTGEGPERWTVRGEMLPKKFGGLTELEMLQAICRSGAPQFLMRGDGTPMGWVVIIGVSDRASYLDRDGVGRLIQFDITLRKSQTPSADAIFNALLSLFP